MPSRTSNRSYNSARDLDLNTGSRYDRRCTQCGVWLVESAENFSYNNGRRAYNAWCKPCVRAYRHSVTAVGVGVGRRFGVEIEFIGSANEVAAAMVAAGLPCTVQQYNHRVSRTAWKIVPDGSVHGGAELVSPILRGSDGFGQLVKAGRALAAANATVNRSTGLHVHHDVRDLRVSAFKTLVNNWYNCQDATDQLVASSRRAGINRFCTPLDDYDLRNVEYLTTMQRRSVARTVMGSRFRTLNLQAYGKYGTVEIRQHQGTVDAEKIAAWVRFGQAMIQAATDDLHLAHSSAESLLTELTLDDDVRSFLLTRVTKLSRPRRCQEVFEP